MVNRGSSEERKPKRLSELFIGRKADKKAVVELLELSLLDSENRKAQIITLCGEAGVGKSRIFSNSSKSSIKFSK